MHDEVQSFSIYSHFGISLFYHSYSHAPQSVFVLTLQQLWCFNILSAVYIHPPSPICSLLDEKPFWWLIGE